jgi:hypothetical protein
MSEQWMWGREAAIGSKQAWHIEFKVLRRGIWVPALPYVCSDEAFARGEAANMERKTDHRGQCLYRDVIVTGPHVYWRPIG